MRGFKKVYLLDPHEALFQEIEVEFLDETIIRSHLECEAVDCFRFDDYHLLYFDDNGLRAGMHYYTMVAGYPDPLGGKLLLALNEEGPFPVPDLELSTALRRFDCFRPVLDPVIENSRISQGSITRYISIVGRFSIRIEPIEIRIITL